MLIRRQHLTTAILAALEADDVLQAVGDNEKPKAGGWQGEPGKSQFVPYVVLTPLASADQGGPLSIGVQDDVTFGYALTSFGINRQTCELVADAARDAIAALKKTNVNLVNHTRRILTVNVQQYGQVERIDTGEPSFHAQTDVVMIVTTPA